MGGIAPVKNKTTKRLGDAVEKGEGDCGISWWRYSMATVVGARKGKRNNG